MNKTAIRRRGYKGGKKKEAYLWNTQKCYIDIPMTCRWGYTFECKVIFTSFSPNNVAFAIGSNNTHTDNSGAKIKAVNTAFTLPTRFVAEVPYTIKAEKVGNNFVVKLNDEVVGTKTYWDNTMNVNRLRIGGYSDVTYINEYNWCLRGGIAYLKIWNGSTLLFDGTPATVNDECGIYDAVSDTFYGNSQSSGSFTIEYY